MDDVRKALDLWPLLADDQRADVAERMRANMVAMVVERGARTPDEARDLLEMFVAAARAELDADEPSPMPHAMNRAARRAQERKK